MTLWLVFVALAAAGIGAGLVALLPGSRLTSQRLEVDPLQPRLTAQVRLGPEQIVIALARELGIALHREDVGYGCLYVTSSSDRHLGLASRSEVGRSYEGEIRLTRRPTHTVLDYYVLALPDGVDEVVTSLMRFDQDLLRVLRGLDREVVVRHPHLDGAGTERVGRLRIAGG